MLGNRIEKSFDDDGAGPHSASVSRCAYDAWKNTNQYLVGNENWDVWADLNGSSSLTTRYLRGDVIDQVFARSDMGAKYWTLTDRLGSVRDVVNSSGTVKDTIAYNGFGGITSESDSNFRGRYAWTGREVEVEIDLQYNRARWYDAGTGRWISQDPLGFDAGDSNLYRYATNRPSFDRDPSGLDGEEELFQVYKQNAVGWLNAMELQIKDFKNYPMAKARNALKAALNNANPNVQNANNLMTNAINLYRTQFIQRLSLGFFGQLDAWNAHGLYLTMAWQLPTLSESICEEYNLQYPRIGKAYGSLLNGLNVEYTFISKMITLAVQKNQSGPVLLQLNAVRNTIITDAALVAVDLYAHTQTHDLILTLLDCDEPEDTPASCESANHVSLKGAGPLAPQAQVTSQFVGLREPL